jgi:BirA family biotin operon repressor/biotin-[acetyl-CoA-carboxylase] ligase
MAVALGVSDALAALAGPGLRCCLKWPNDVLAATRSDVVKVAGILCEAHGPFALAGVGVNVRQAPGALPAGAASLRSLGVCLDRGAALVAVLEGVDWHLARLAAGHDPLPAWRARLHTLGRPVSASTPAGPVAGVAVDVAPDGALQVALSDGSLVTLYAGDVHLLSA